MDMAEDLAEDYPLEIEEQLKTFQSSVASVNTMVQTMLSMPRQELVQKLDPLEQAKLDLMSAYTLNSLFWMYLVTQGINPKEHGIKQELERIRTYMNRVKEITDRKKAARLDKGAVSRFVRNALWDSEEAASKKEEEVASKTEGTRSEKEEGSKRRKNTPGRGQHSKRSKTN